MQLNVLLLPLLGGFLFLSIFRRTAYFIARQSAAALSFWLAVVGLTLLVVARLAIMLSQHAMAGPSAVAVPILNALLIPLLGMIDVGLMMYALTDLLQRRTDPAYRRPLGQIIGGFLIFVLVVDGLVATWNHLPSHSTLAGISLPILWVVELFVFVEAAARWANRIRVATASIVFRASLVGLLLLSVTASAMFYPEPVKEFWLNFSGPTGGQIPSDELGTSILAALLGPLLAFAANLLYPRIAVESYLFTRRTSNSLERLLYRATSRGSMVMITLDDGKVYCGYVDWIPGNPGSADAFLEVLPIFSGYRESETKRVSLPVTYAPFLERLDKQEWSQFKKVVPVASVASAGEFDPEYFEAFAKRAAGPADTPAARADSTTPSPQPNQSEQLQTGSQPPSMDS